MTEQRRELGVFLEDRDGSRTVWFGAVDAEELAAQAEAAPREGSGELPTGEPIVPASADREDSARRMVFVAALGLFFPPLAFFALYLFLNAAFGERALSPRGRFNLWIGGAMMLGGLCWMGLFLRLFYG